MIDLDEIEAKARAATMGSWHLEHRTKSDLDGQKWESFGPCLVMSTECDRHPVADCSAHHSCYGGTGEAESNAVHIASASPATVLAMVVEIRRLREALRPFAKAGELFPPRDEAVSDQAIYAPAAGKEYSICGDDLRRARAALEGGR